MIKTLRNQMKRDKENVTVPQSVQEAIPIRAIYEDGIFELGGGRQKPGLAGKIMGRFGPGVQAPGFFYSKTFRFDDINYAVASKEDKEALFLEYGELLNALDSGAATKITINNRRINQNDFEKTILIPMQEDGLDIYRKEYNQMLLDKISGGNGIVQEKYITVTVMKKEIDEARAYFARIGSDLITHFSRLGSACVEPDITDRLRIFHDFYRAGEETNYRFDLSETMRKGHDFKDFIGPDTFEYERDCFRIGDKWGRVLFLREYASYIKDSMVSELCRMNRNMMFSIDILPVPTDEAVREVENRLLGVETNITNWQRKESKEFLDDLTTRDQRMMFATVTLAHTFNKRGRQRCENAKSPYLLIANKGFPYIIISDNIFGAFAIFKEGRDRMSKYVYKVIFAIILVLIAKD